MRFSHRVLGVVVLLVGGLMAVSEAPELLALTDNVSNDCESVQIVRPGARGCLSTHSTREITPPQTFPGASASSKAVALSLSFLSSGSTRSLLALLVTQRK